MHIPDTLGDQQVPPCAVFLGFVWLQYPMRGKQNCKGSTTVEQSSHLASWSMSTINQPEQKGHARYACSLQGDTWVYTTYITMSADLFFIMARYTL